MNAENKTSFINKLLGPPRRIIGVGGVFFLAGVSIFGYGINDAMTFSRDIKGQVDSAVGVLPSDQLNAARGKLDVQARINDLMGQGWSNWNSDLNQDNVEGLRKRMDGLRQISEELDSAQTDRALAVLTLDKQRTSYAAELRVSSFYTLPVLGHLASSAIGAAMTLAGVVGLRKGLGAIGK